MCFGGMGKKEDVLKKKYRIKTKNKKKPLAKYPRISKAEEGSSNCNFFFFSDSTYFSSFYKFGNNRKA